VRLQRGPPGFHLLPFAKLLGVAVVARVLVPQPQLLQLCTGCPSLLLCAHLQGRDPQMSCIGLLLPEMSWMDEHDRPYSYSVAKRRAVS